ncbi:MAG: ABC transporter substrate-binding protein [Winogradskyella sp.]|nr:ABC transporter substrate-binding protein [Winogradskyella sp.]MBT8375857.1 ABC transporter substrate-binding protein [Bacteroidia bacterium]NNC46378.1 ABC transporter substrate-binding protein [Winogradskyella sp.]NNF85643.1 ABC transporter substrate-binding protein [Winogradskyella sp.]NNK40785.1 ABC transporter substrate-binding protein [Winogradskyella sp.]
MTNIKIGGVPEHFNLAWYLTLKNKEYQAQNINLRWKDYYEGTGAMCMALRKGDIDIAVILTEGIIKDIVDGNPSKIVQVFVKSPLIWGIHVAHKSKYQNIKDLKGKKAAISRYGSGSHLMAYINAKNNDWNLETDLKFKVVKNLSNAVKNISEGKSDYFMWEKFTTKPLVDDEVFRCIDDCPTPWPCFVIAVSEKALINSPEAIATILKIINTTTSEFKAIPSIDQMIANRYHQNIEDVRLWLSLTEWSQEQISLETIDQAQDQLFNLGLIDKKLAGTDFINTI